MIPIFIIICDRIEMLKKSMQSYRDQIEMPIEFIMIDMDSTYPPMIKYLKELEKGGIKVYWESKVNVPTELNKINKNIQDYFRTNPQSSYIVTDPDVALDNVNGDILEVYAHLLKTMPEINVVGPMLRIDDIPDYYPPKKWLLKNSRHRNFHRREAHIINYNGGQIKYIFAKIDTTFGMFRAGTQWRRLQRGIRTFAPYLARHLDWYLNPKNLTQDYKYYIEHASKNIAHWSMWK